MWVDSAKREKGIRVLEVCKQSNKQLTLYSCRQNEVTSSVKLPNKLCNEVRVIARQGSELITLCMCVCVCLSRMYCNAKKVGKQRRRGSGEAEYERGDTSRVRHLLYRQCLRALSHVGQPMPPYQIFCLIASAKLSPLRSFCCMRGHTLPQSLKTSQIR